MQNKERFEELFRSNYKQMMRPSHHFSLGKIAAIFIGILWVSGTTYAAMAFNRSSSDVQSAQKAQTGRVMSYTPAKSIDAQPADTAATQKEQSFDNVELQTILDDISSYYKLEVVYQSDRSRHLRLHFHWDKTKDAAFIVESLNHFENVNITLIDRKIEVK